MVTTIYTRKRFAFTMIELIFAIVIIAIAVLSLPMMAQITQRGIESNIVQEAIFAASSELMGATSGYWDENSMQDNADSDLSRVIDISNDCNATTNLRPGHIFQPYHRRCLNTNATDAYDSAIGGTFFDLDNAVALVNGTPALFDNPSADATGYKDTYTSAMTINRTGDVKTIQITINDSDGNPVTTLRVQSANVGEIDYYKRML